MTSQPKFCGTCGSPLPENAKFCGKCGQPTQKVSGQPQNQGSGKDTSQSSSFDLNDFYERNKKVVWIVGGLLLLLLISGGSLFRIATLLIGVVVPCALLGGLGYLIYRIVKKRQGN